MHVDALIEHMAIYVIKSIYIHIKGQVMDLSISVYSDKQCPMYLEHKGVFCLTN